MGREPFTNAIALELIYSIKVVYCAALLIQSELLTARYLILLLPVNSQGICSLFGIAANRLEMAVFINPAR